MLLEMIVLLSLVLANGLFAGAEIGIERVRLSQLTDPPPTFSHVPVGRAEQATAGSAAGSERAN
jgi:hypothetical protein